MCTVVKINLAMCTESIGITFEGSNHDFATEQLCMQVTYPL